MEGVKTLKWKRISSIKTRVVCYLTFLRHLHLSKKTDLLTETSQKLRLELEVLGIRVQIAYGYDLHNYCIANAASIFPIWHNHKSRPSTCAPANFRTPVCQKASSQRKFGPFQTLWEKLFWNCCCIYILEQKI